MPPHSFSLPLPSVLFSLTLAFFGWMGCASHPARTPEDALQAYANALEEGDSDAAYALLSSDAQSGLSKARFRALLLAHPTEAKELGKALRHPTGNSSAVTKVSTEEGRELEFFYENGSWKLNYASLDLYAQDTPKHALFAFVTALEYKRYDKLHALIPSPLSAVKNITENDLKQAVEVTQKEKFNKLFLALKETLKHSSPEIQGDRASMLWSGGRLHLLLETANGQKKWVIEDF